MLSAALMLPVSRLIAHAERFDERYFQHGIASGDPLQECVIIWTRVSARDYADKTVLWEVALDARFKDVINKGFYKLSSKTDYTVKVDVKGLEAGTSYYYRFSYRDMTSPIGITKTLPASLDNSNFTMAVVSCNNWEDGYFNSFRFLAQKARVDLILHLGDYIYEYETGKYGNPKTDRINKPAHETVTLDDYRTRYAYYRTDEDLQELHANKPFYLIFDDHEIANDTYNDGAQNHQKNEGLWETRKKAAIQAYLEWMPIRAKKLSQVRRKFEIGTDISLYLMDQRTTGRTKQMKNSEASFNSDKRTLIGDDQYDWLAKELKRSKTVWNLIGNQVMFSGYTVKKGYKLPKYNDWWLGYPYERAKLMEMLEKENIRNPIFLTGDHHESFVLAVNKEEQFMHYTKSYQEKPLAWELLTPSITSKNGDRKSASEILEFEEMLLDHHVNPHMAYCDIKSHGYMMATISKRKFAIDYFFVDNILTKKSKEVKKASFVIDADSFKLEILK